ncbi:Uma2 family endonuclease [Leptolyngbya sp. FACHB-261]|uniref:Uma2 family endonuclease n=1 Tax=Leptolyngbya sp. FACHB-261 TaxID=2692806 RepID=UPI0016855B19|nr:Uma2 family endonuclease [Leptolyngbya sp. FACHB-261]MBD2104322.1 Uma2 family endonuclease [Leptolyngbya sp. FACHB-261]
MSQLKTQLLTDQWVPATWEEYLAVLDEPDYQQSRGYYYDGHLRIEMSPVGSGHSRRNTVVIFAINLFCTLKGIPLNGLTNCSYRKTGVQECQPDVSYYIGERAQSAPDETSVVDLDRYPPPNLVIEIANSSLGDDLGRKRLLYEDLGVSEYWVIDVNNAQVIAFEIYELGSKRMTQSKTLPGLSISLIEEALRRSRETDQSQVGTWLLTKLQEPRN